MQTRKQKDFRNKDTKEEAHESGKIIRPLNFQDHTQDFQDHKCGQDYSEKGPEIAKL